MYVERGWGALGVREARSSRCVWCVAAVSGEGTNGLCLGDGEGFRGVLETQGLGSRYQ